MVFHPFLVKHSMFFNQRLSKKINFCNFLPNFTQINRFIIKIVIDMCRLPIIPDFFAIPKENSYIL